MYRNGVGNSVYHMLHLYPYMNFENYCKFSVDYFISGLTRAEYYFLFQANNLRHTIHSPSWQLHLSLVKLSQVSPRI